MLSSWDVIAGLNYEALLLLVVEPSGLPWPPMVQHIGIWNKPVSLDAVHSDTEDSTGDHHPDFRILLQWVLREGRDLFADQVVINFDVFKLLIDLVEERRTFQKSFLLIGEEDREVP